MSVDNLHRQTNLVFTLIDASHRGRGRSPQWIRAHVEGYQGRGDEAFRKMLSRDIRTLRKIGVPVSQTPDEICVPADSYQLPPVEFAPQEATVLGLAGEMGEHSTLGAFAGAGWAKIAAAGAHRDLAGVIDVDSYSDFTRLPSQSFAAVLTAVDKQQQVSFTYRRRPGVTETRTLEPWGLVQWQGRLYLAGWDVDRQAERVFRTTKLSGIERVRVAAEHERPGDVQAVVEKALSRRRADITVRAEVALPELSNRTGEFTLHDIEIDPAVRFFASVAPEVVVVKPNNVKKQVVDLLEEAL